MNLVAPAGRPLFTWNSQGVMLGPGQGLARFLGVPPVCAEFAAPTRPGRRRLGWAVLVASAAWLLDRRIWVSRRG